MSSSVSPQPPDLVKMSDMKGMHEDDSTKKIPRRWFKWLCTTPNCPYLSHEDSEEFKGFCCQRCFEYNWKCNGKVQHGHKCQRMLPRRDDCCQRFACEGDPKHQIFTRERFLPSRLLHVEECWVHPLTCRKRETCCSLFECFCFLYTFFFLI